VKIPVDWVGYFLLPLAVFRSLRAPTVRTITLAYGFGQIDSHVICAWFTGRTFSANSHLLRRRVNKSHDMFE